ncbi:ArnT family glycosyltransferase [Calycomorphotria hydatis]|uniref:Undecaprenyl phosphate-alpha-4-amino-4-deoxy-L-arabinose arabinosyl transferase n=1 Tax=Calycomorphotria hydatis TaxID=2528027 RepID=A0A517T6B6_9PLAN|nr:glycosyltransferase family 39 protein [Calycomorphotria hydatis]QDT63917.1 Undecaprenyl phosphate-alpha-4-amino-4-deoxy-L-arabinose arabinosyl transferase [Calycomorphotria hydatis]
MIQRDIAIISLVAGLMFFVNLGSARLFDDDEPKNAGCAAEMLERGDWMVPMFNYELRTHKPILLYWCMLTAYSVFGVNEFAARLPSATFGVGIVLITYLIGRMLYDRKAGLWSALILATSLMFDMVARAANPDATLIFPCMLAFWSYLWLVARQHGGQFPQEMDANDWPKLLPRGWGLLLPYSAMSVAVLAKGPIGFLLPCTGIGAFVYFKSLGEFPELTGKTLGQKVISWSRYWVRPLRLLQVMWAMKPPLLIGALSVIALPWYVAVGVLTDGAWISGFFGTHNFGRFTNAMEGHGGLPIYYLVAISIGMFPWSLLFPVAFTQIYCRLSSNKIDLQNSGRTADLFLISWIAAYVVFFSIARTKLPNYVLPCYPAIALVAGTFFSRWRPGFDGLSRVWHRLYCPALVLIGAGMGVGLPITAYFLMPDEMWLGVIGLFPITAGICAYILFERGQSQQAKQVIFATAFGMAAVAFWIAAPRVSEYQAGPVLAKAAAEHNPTKKVAILGYGYHKPNITYYARTRFVRRDDLGQLKEHFVEHPDGYLLVRRTTLAEIESELPSNIRELKSHGEFLRDREIVMLGPVNKPDMPVNRIADQSTTQRN